MKIQLELLIWTYGSLSYCFGLEGDSTRKEIGENFRKKIILSQVNVQNLRDIVKKIRKIIYH